MVFVAVQNYVFFCMLVGEEMWKFVNVSLLSEGQKKHFYTLSTLKFIQLFDIFLCCRFHDVWFSLTYLHTIHIGDLLWQLLSTFSKKFDGRNRGSNDLWLLEIFKVSRQQFVLKLNLIQIDRKASLKLILWHLTH